MTENSRENTAADPAKVKELFSRLAKKYDTGNKLISFGTHLAFKRKALLELNLKPGEKLLDLCTGTGDMAFLAAELFPGIQVTGVDFSPEMIDIADERADKNPLLRSRLKFLVADAPDLPFEDDEYDGAVVAFGLRNIPDKAAFFEEAFRVLKPQKKLVVLEFSNPKDSSIGPLYRLYLNYLVPLLGWVASGDFEAYRYLTSSIMSYPPVREIMKTAESAGFRFSYRLYLMGGLSVYNCLKPDE
jgi:demethylmenaquinone methyltransferase/2-methoxy-6-polyprenyl-1,4-benzoquinol methylase